MRERADDLKDLRDQLVARLLGVSGGGPRLTRPSILVADELTPSETMGLDTSLAAGFLLRRGGPTSHTAILARALGVPAVVGAGAAADGLTDGQELWLDGGAGQFAPTGDPEADREFRRRQEGLQRRGRADEECRGRATRTADGTEIELAANVTAPAFQRLAVDNDAEGVGLFRSEFLYLDQAELPDEEKQLAAYRSVLEELAPRPVIVRTMDVGGDKEAACLGLPREENPFLGCRAIRVCLRRPGVFRTQLRALLRASVFGTLKIMFPMISSLRELRQAKAAVEQAKAELRAEGIPFDPEVPVGMMVEIPSAALMADAFAREADFFSIGTNDLTQYTLAVDRGNETVAELYSALEPGVLRLIAMTARAARQAGIPCGMCGEAAADPRLLPVWLGLGLTELSVSPKAVLPTRRRIAGLRDRDCRAAAEQVVELEDAEQVERWLAEHTAGEQEE